MKALFIVIAVITSLATLRAQDLQVRIGHHQHHHGYEQDYDPDSGVYHHYQNDLMSIGLPISYGLLSNVSQ